MYYEINETAARRAHEMSSMRDYIENSETNQYRAYVDEAYRIGAERKEKYPEESERIDRLCDRYAKKLADWYNTGFAIEQMCPSILIAGGSNFPVAKKEKQNARRDTHMREWDELTELLRKIASCGTDAIKSGDGNVIEKLKSKLESRIALQEQMKKENAEWRKDKAAEGYPPHPSWELSNNNAEIRRLKARIAEIEKKKESGNSERHVGIEGVKLIENTELMRIQFVFDDIPSAEIREILKGHAFKWSPKNKAWQRVLNGAGQSAADSVIKAITEELQNERA